MKDSHKIITRRSVLRLIGGMAVLGASRGHASGTTSPRRPHILFIHVDDLGWSDLGCQGATHYSTPAIDALAREGMRFTQAYAGAPVCTPSRACLVTGLHCARLHTTGQPGYKTEDTRTRKFAHPDFRTTFPVGTPCVARTLAAAGYHTAIFGKWGFDDSPQEHGFAQSFDGSDEALVDAALGVLGQARSPVFAYLNYTRPHVPIRPDPARIAAFAARPEFKTGNRSPAYAAELEAMNRVTGRLLDGIDRHGLREDTLVVFTSDNGGFLGYDDERLADNSPLREGKASLYEGGIRVPLIVRWPGVIAPGINDDTLVHGVDWHATLADLAKTALPSGETLDGVNFAPVLRGTGAIRSRPLYWHYPHYRRSMAGLAASPSSAVRIDDWKLLHFYETDGVELYNLRNDPGETSNLAHSQPDQAARLRRQLDGWRTAVGAQPPVPQPIHPLS